MNERLSTLYCPANGGGRAVFPCSCDVPHTAGAASDTADTAKARTVNAVTSRGGDRRMRLQDERTPNDVVG